MQPDDPAARSGAPPSPAFPPLPASPHRRGREHRTRADLEPPWSLLLVGILVILLTFALPVEVRGEMEIATRAQRWLQLALFGGMVFEAILWLYYHWTGHDVAGHPRPGEAHPRWCELLFRPLVWATTIILTLWLVASLVVLIGAVSLRSDIHAHHILQSGAILWITNVLVFARWYWLVDRVRPHFAAHRRRREVLSRSPAGRHRTEAAGVEAGARHTLAFWFPQMAHEVACATGLVHWHPGFLDYLFLAFNTSTALSPTDTAVLSRWAKTAMMVQALISLLLIVIVFARAVNTLFNGQPAPAAHAAVSAGPPGRSR